MESKFYILRSLIGLQIILLTGISCARAQSNSASFIFDSVTTIQQHNSIEPFESECYTGLIYKLDKPRFNKGFFLRAEDLFQGKFPGLNMYSENGIPGSMYEMSQHCSGFSSGSQTPLILVDNIPVSLDELNFHTGDIENIAFLPGGIASSFYGWEAGNGVILINTQRIGNNFSFSYQSRGAITQLVNPIDNFDEASFRELITEKFSDNPEVAGLPGDYGTDWQKEIYRTGFGHDHYISASGTNFKIPWRASVGYTSADGIVKTSKYQRTIAGISIYPAFFQGHLKVNMNLNGTFINNRLANQKAIGAAVFMDPTQQVYAENDYGGYFTYLLPSGEQPNPIAPSNPVSLIEQSDFRRESDLFFGNLNIVYRFHFLPELSFNLKAGYRSLGHDYLDVTDSLAAWTYRPGQSGRVSEDFGTRNTTFLSPVLNYSPRIKSINTKIDISAGNTRSSIIDNYTSSERDMQGNHLADSISRENASNKYSFFGFMQGSVMDRYLLNFGYMFAGSSQFSENNRSEGYPSFGLAWKVKQEPFSDNIKFIDEFTLHFNFSVSPGGLSNFYSNSSVSDKGQQGTVFDPNLKHERHSTTEYGVRFSLLAARISGSFVVYKQLHERLIMAIPAPIGININNFIFANAAEVERKGYNFMLSVKVVETEKLAFSLGFNLNHDKNKITSLKTGDSSYPINTGQITGGVGNFIMQQREGYPLNSYFVLSQVYDSEGNPIEGVYFNFSGEPGNVAQNEKNKYLYKKPDPDLIIGMSANLSYGGWKLGVAGRLVAGNYLYNNTASTAYYQAIVGSAIQYLRNLPVSVQESGFVTPQYFSDYYIENASFFRLDNIHLGYTFTRLSKLNADFEVFASVQNALVVTNYSGQDPEVKGGIDYYNYPRPRIFALGVNFGF